MPDMKSTSASLYGSRPSPGGVACRPDEGVLAQPNPNAATNRNAAIASRETVLIRAPNNGSYAIRPRGGTLHAGWNPTKRRSGRRAHDDMRVPRGALRIGRCGVNSDVFARQLHVHRVAGGVSVGALLQDIRFALRSVRRSPAVPLAAIATIAVGIGATTAIFATLNAVLLKPL